MVKPGYPAYPPPPEPKPTFLQDLKAIAWWLIVAIEILVFVTPVVLIAYDQLGPVVVKMLGG
jgi:hypothetical protein